MKFELILESFCFPCIQFSETCSIEINALISMSDLDSYYRVLGLEPGATMEEVNQAYRDLVFVWHPDRLPKDNPRLQEIADRKIKELNQARDRLRSSCAQSHGTTHAKSSTTTSKSSPSKNSTGAAREPRPEPRTAPPGYHSYQTPPRHYSHYQPPVSSPNNRSNGHHQNHQNNSQNNHQNRAGSQESQPSTPSTQPQSLRQSPDLSEANLSGADLHEKDLSSRNLSRADLSNANLSDAFLHRINLSGANLSGANLFRANLLEADLSQANLQGANLIGADLSGADLRGANLRGARIGVSDRLMVKLTGARLSGMTMPDGSIHA